MAEAYFIKYIAKGIRRRRWKKWRERLMASPAAGLIQYVRGSQKSSQGYFFLYILQNSQSVCVSISNGLPSLKSNVCICRSLTRRCVDHNALSQWHALLCKWGSFIIVMLFMLLIHTERGARGESGIRHRGPTLFTHSLFP